MIDSTLNRNLFRWGRARLTEYLGYPTVCAYLTEYIPKGYARDPTVYDEDIEPLSDLIDKLLNRRQTEALKCKYRYRINKRMSAKHMSCSKEAYMDYFDQAIDILTRNMP